MCYNIRTFKLIIEILPRLLILHCYHFFNFCQGFVEGFLLELAFFFVEGTLSWAISFSSRPLRISSALSM